MVRDLHSMLLGLHVMLKSNPAIPHRVSGCGEVAATMAIMVTMAITAIAGGAVTMKTMGATAMT
ncbi:hypothetical protein RS3R2_21970 [Pseudomonas lactis]|nr:hypothetical protein RS3R2_21970 [Pseudomonas lactis]